MPAQISVTLSFCCNLTDCGTNYPIENGYVDYKGRATTVGEKVPVFCNPGYDLEGDSDTTCLSDGTWSKFTHCRSKGMVNIFA